MERNCPAMVPFFNRFRESLTALFSGKPPPPAQEKERAQRRKMSSGRKKGEPQSPRFAFVCLNSDRVPEEDILKEKIAKWLQLDSEDEIEDFEMSGDDMEAATFQIGPHTAIIARMPTPIPASDIDYACTNSILWRDAALVLRKHTSHLIVTVMGDFDTPLDEAMFLSCVIAACTEAYDSCAVYWGHASVVHRPEFFREQIQQVEEGQLPVIAWVGFLLAQGGSKGTIDLYTRGLDVFGLMEIEVHGTDRPLSDVLGRVTELCSYLLKNGNVIGDGHTVGGTEEERVRAHHVESAIGRGGKVLRIEF